MEVLYSIPTLTVRRFRMNQIHALNGLETDLSEAILVVTEGTAELQEEMKSNVFRMGSQDFCYLPPGDRFSVTKASEKCEILWASAPATGKFEPYFKKHADSERTESGSRDNGTHRVSTRMINRFDKSERLRMGYTEADKGGWTSFPPHRHDGIPEVYVFTGMGKGFGLQMVWDGGSERTYIVRDGDAVGFNEGYHPNVGDPSTNLKFYWVLSSDPASPMRTPDGGFTPVIHPGFRDFQDTK
ncbi:MAG: 5-deoxy-glucuronate isomerase [Thaumarchaeota archaeon]|nr:5-deoxy-glucuronate isomerase [Nitrososphaerota archaeon]